MKMKANIEDKMDIEEFTKLCEKDNFNKVKEWDIKKFRVFCAKCCSDEVTIFFREESGRMGSEFTGYMKGFNKDNELIVKCKKCGSAMEFDLPEY